MLVPCVSVGLNCKLASPCLLCAQLHFLWEVSAFIIYSGREGPSDSSKFQGLPESILSYSP